MPVMTMRSAALAAMLFGALCASAPAFAGTANVVIKNFDFSPMAIAVPVGTTVTWKNLDGEPHTVVSADGLFRSKALDQNDSFSFKFDKRGLYKYVCSIHPRMMATITVQ
jgi:plastocyanin